MSGRRADEGSVQLGPRGSIISGPPWVTEQVAASRCHSQTLGPFQKPPRGGHLDELELKTLSSGPGPSPWAVCAVLFLTQEARDIDQSSREQEATFNLHAKFWAEWLSRAVIVTLSRM